MGNDASARRWATRRERYGPRGHGSSYARWSRSEIEHRALALLMQLHEEAVLSEGQLCQALRMERVEFRELRDQYANTPKDTDK